MQALKDDPPGTVPSSPPSIDCPHSGGIHVDYSVLPRLGFPTSLRLVHDTFTTCSRLVHDRFLLKIRSYFFGGSSSTSRHYLTTRSRQQSWTCRERVVNLSGTRWITRICLHPRQRQRSTCQIKEDYLLHSCLNTFVHCFIWILKLGNS
jgi:hypothetical protein